jgi:hypothetical protein
MFCKNLAFISAMQLQKNEFIFKSLKKTNCVIVFFTLFLLFLPVNYGKTEDLAQNKKQVQKSLSANTKRGINSDQQNLFSEEKINPQIQSELNKKSEFLDYREKFLDYRDKNYDSWLKLIAIILSAFSILLTATLFALAFWGFKDLRSLKKDFEDDMKELKKEMNELDNYKTALLNNIEKLMDPVNIQNIIEQTIKATYTNQVNKMEERATTLENYVKDLRAALKNNQEIPEFPELETEIRQETKNTFDEE